MAADNFSQSTTDTTGEIETRYSEIGGAGQHQSEQLIEQRTRQINGAGHRQPDANSTEIESE